MRIAVTGTIATDHLMYFPGRFADQLLPDRLHALSLSFLVDRLEMRRGGGAANIAYGMGRLGLTPTLVAAVGTDCADHQIWLKQHGVDIDSVLVVPGEPTARFVCTTDVDDHRIGAFYPGAMRAACTISLQGVAERVGGIDLVVISPDDPAAMLRHTEECRTWGLPFAADPSRRTAGMNRQDVQFLLDGARYLFTNEYEAAVLQESTGWSALRILERVGVRFITLGAAGVLVERAGQEPFVVPAVPDVSVADPTGAGDALRAGLLCALARGASLRTAAQLGCALASLALESVGTQEYAPTVRSLAGRIRGAYGEEALAAAAPVLAGSSLAGPSLTGTSLAGAS
ncbi:MULTISPECIES: carbohydrate kinase family protein [unclassified Streptomyces]|uniref:carbohydrate kinase family protein n=1 Tax=unclassified Streptomyces TaxID=2593676 RepID=UPI0033E5764F